MLDRDPNPPRPPDSSPPRPRPRPHKPKNAPKKQPQRGMGVAQLEKLLLEEQSKQEFVCFSSLHHQHHSRFHHQSQHQQQEQPQQQQLHLHNYHHQQQKQQLLLQPQHHRQTSSFSLTHQIKFTEPSPDKSAFPALSGYAEPRLLHPSAKFNAGNVQNSFIPLADMASRRQTLPLPLLITQYQQQQSGDQSERCLSPVLQVHDLCSPASAICCITTNPSSAHGLLPSPLFPPATLALSAPFPHILASGASETPWLNQHSDRDSDIAIFSAACLSGVEEKMQGSARDVYATAGNVHATAGQLHATAGSLHVAVGNLKAQSEGSLAPFNDLSLQRRPMGAFNSPIPSRNRVDSPVVSIAPAEVQTRELSSFQTISVCPTWSPENQVFNRKRPWASTQEPARDTQTFKGVDLNTSIDEIESESTGRDSACTNIAVPAITRDSWSLSPLLMPTENDFELLSTSRACNECGLMTAENHMASSAVKVNTSDNLVNGAAFLSLTKRNMDFDMLEVETSGEFLSLGASCSAIQKLGNTHLGTGNKSSCPITRKPSETARTWQPQQMFSEQVKGLGKLLCEIPPYGVPIYSDGLMTMAEEYQANCFSSPLQMNVELFDFLAWNKAEGYLQQNRADESLDLELRLSI